MPSATRQILNLLLSGLVLTLVAACASPPHRAPVEDRKPPKAGARLPGVAASAPPLADAGMPPPAPLPAETVKLPPGAENAGKPGFYTVKPGDTLIRLSLENGQNWRDVARWNGMENANVIEVGQVLRMLPPGVDAAAVASRGVSTAKVETRPLDARPAGTAASGVPPPPLAVDNEGEPDWAWPAAGSVLSGFDESKQKGLAIAGKAGDPVLAAADGRVVYAGAGLRGYGNLVIVKHNNTYLTAYAHNQALMVKEDQAVRRGQKIAEMGSSDADRVQLHFEIRRQGKPVDPSRLLPAR